jgi:peptidoglycan hydrolase CwlO-like protein
MKEFFLKYFKEILLVVFGIVLIFLIVKIYTPAPDKSDLLKYKLNQLDQTISDLKKRQKDLNDSITKNKEDIIQIDKNIDDIKSQKTTINNYYEIKDKEIPKWTNKQVDSAFRARYKY